MPSPPVAPTMNPRVQAAWDAYQRAPDDRAAFTHLITTAVELGEERVLSRLEAREVAHVNETRAHQKKIAIVQTVNDAVAKEAPDVDLDIFWNFGRRAQAETPRHIVHPSARIEWQMKRAIELARAKQQALIAAATSSAPATGPPKSMVAFMREMAPRAAGAPPAAEQPKNMVEFMREMRSRQ